MSLEDAVVREQLFPAGRGLLLRPATEQPLAELIDSHRARIFEELLSAGAILLRGFVKASPVDFAAAVAALGDEKMDYVYGSTPRTAVGDQIFTASEYPAGREIPLHSEDSYQREWPLKLAFFCEKRSITGGQTPLADLRKVTSRLGAELMQRFRDGGVRYVRHFRPFIDVSWERSFGSADRTVVKEICEARGIQSEWLSADVLRTTQVCQGTALHPQTGEEVFFNQAHLFSASALSPADRSALVEICGKGRIPRHATFGDGSEFGDQDLETVRHAIKAETCAFDWEEGDLLLLDNMQMLHGRSAFTGERRHLAALLGAHAGA